jgi:membrane fusion protein, heavy metal efflux system
MTRTTACAVLLAFACARHEERERTRAPAGEVWLSQRQLEAQDMRIAVVGEAEVRTTLDVPGRIAFDDSRVAHVFAPASGRIVRLIAAPGQRVRRGDPLLEIDSPDVAAALSDLQKADADLAAAAQELRRQEELVEAHAAARRELEQARSAWERARAERARAARRAGLFERGGAGAARQFFLRAPIDGEVIARAANPGTDVQGQLSGGTAPELFTIGSIDSVWVLADVYEADLSQVKPGQRLQVKVIAYPDRTFPGQVEWIAAALDPVTRTARLRSTLPNPARELLPEMYATVSIETPPRKALVVPRSAVLHVGDERVVFVQAGNTEAGLLRFQRRRVVLDEGDGDQVPVRSGLQPGEAVVVSGALLLSGML